MSDNSNFSTGYKEAVKRIERAKRDTGRTLDLSNLDLADLPPSFSQLGQLSQLYLSDNALTSLPMDLGQLCQLHLLDLSNNRLTALPPTVGNLAQLRELFLSHNQITTLPPTVGQLAQLQVLHLSDNLLTSLPPELQQVKKLTEMFLHGNPLLNLPESILGSTWDDVFNGRGHPASPAAILQYYMLCRETGASAPRRPELPDEQIPKGDTSTASIGGGASADGVKELMAKGQQPDLSSTAVPPLRVFVSYASRDKALKEQFDLNLKVLSLRNLITIWSDKQLAGGEVWNDKIAVAIKEADVIIFMVSNSFLASDYIREHEMPLAMAQGKAGKAVIVPVVLKDCAWEEEEWSEHQALPTGVIPVTEWPDLEKAFHEVEKGLRRVLQRLREQKLQGLSN